MTQGSAMPWPIFRCDAGAAHGLGHLMRCLALADAFVTAGSPPACFVTHSPDGMAARLIAQRGHAVQPSPSAAGSFADRQTLGSVCTAAAERPVLVIDSKSVDGAYVAAFRDSAFVVCLDDEEARDFACDVLVNNNVWSRPEDYSARPGRRLCLGPDFNLVRDEFFEIGRQRRNQGPGPLRLLITLGGEDPGNLSLWLMSALDSLLADREVAVIVGQAHPDPTSLHRLAAARSAIKVHENVVNIAEHVAWCDLAITAGGTTCYELAAARVAMAALVLEAHQQRLVEAMRNAGCLVVAGRYDELSPDRAADALVPLLRSAEKRRSLGSAGGALFAREGSSRLVEAIVVGWRENRERAA